MKAAIAKRTLDNITIVMVAFTHFKKLAFPSSMPDSKGEDMKDYETRDSAHSKEPTLKGRKSEEPPDHFAYKKLIDSSSPGYTLGGTQSPKFHNNNHKLFHNNDIAKEDKNKFANDSFKKGNAFGQDISEHKSHVKTDSHHKLKNPAQNMEKVSMQILTEKMSPNIMKVGNLFMFNVFKNDGGGVDVDTPSGGRQFERIIKRPASHLKVKKIPKE